MPLLPGSLAGHGNRYPALLLLNYALAVHLRTVRKYDPLREQKPARTTREQLKEIKEACGELVAEGLAYESNGWLRISPFGRRACERF